MELCRLTGLTKVANMSKLADIFACTSCRGASWCTSLYTQIDRAIGSQECNCSHFKISWESAYVHTPRTWAGAGEAGVNNDFSIPHICSSATHRSLFNSFSEMRFIRVIHKSCVSISGWSVRRLFNDVLSAITVIYFIYIYIYRKMRREDNHKSCY